MNWLPPSLLITPVVLLLSLGLIPSRRANHAPLLLGWLTTMVAGLAFLFSLVAASQVIITGPMNYSFTESKSPVPVCLGVHVDSVAVVMMALISFIGMIVARYSTRYLLGDPQQGRFFRWMSFTLGATILLVMSCNLVLFTTAWMLTSFGLHQLLLYYPDRPWAIWAARKKFLISRLGDAMLIAAMVLTYRCFGTTEYTEIFAAADKIHNGTTAGNLSTALIGVLFVLGAITKSAQFPFHSWLPDTMETPTPVSALMHAGVINAGGFLVIRLSPIVSLSPIALELLALIGAVTAIVGSVVMLTQTSIKRSLAYSTIAQMGFMMLQCGLGAFSAALLHIVAHSAYKAHSFLSSGSVLDNAARMKVPTMPVSKGGRSALALVAAIGIATAIVGGTFRVVGIDIITKPGGIVLGFILTLALVQLLWNALATGVVGLSLRSIANALLVTMAYSVAYLVIDKLVASATSHYAAVPSALDIVILSIVALGFVGLFTLQGLSEALARQRWVRALYVHALHGFYIDVPARRLTARIYGVTAPVP